MSRGTGSDNAPIFSARSVSARCCTRVHFRVSDRLLLTKVFLCSYWASFWVYFCYLELKVQTRCLKLKVYMQHHFIKRSCGSHSSYSRLRGLHVSFLTAYGWRKKRGQPISLQIFWKLHDRIAWKLVNFCNIICSTQSLTFCLKNFIALWRHLAKIQLLCDDQICLYRTVWINDSSGVFARWRHSAMKFLNKKLMTVFSI